MRKSRTIEQTWKSKGTLEGAGVHLKRAFGFSETPQFDPFLLLDDFRSDTPKHYLKGFPWHPHRGIETITYVLRGDVEHGDSIGNSGTISSGDVQWMTAGSGIIHQEMPKGDENGIMQGFQLWANLPAKQKMTEPKYRDVRSDQIPLVRLENGVEIRIICGSVGTERGPVHDIVIDPEYLDITVPPETVFAHSTKTGHTAIAYVIGGQGYFEKGENRKLLGNETLVHFSEGNEIVAETKKEPVRFLFFSGKPIKEPIAWYGPIVMNTEEELRIAFEEYRAGTFIKHQKP